MKSSTAIVAVGSLPVPGVLLLSEAQAAQAAGVSRKTIRRLIEKGRLRAADYGTGGHHNYRINPSDLVIVQAGSAGDGGDEAPTPPGRRARAGRRKSAEPQAVADLWP